MSLVRRAGRLASLAAACVVLAACGSSSASGPTVPVIPAARTFQLAGFRPDAPATPGRPTTLSFTIRQPSGAPLTSYRSGTGPHTGVHLIIVRSDLGAIIHRHPRPDVDGKVSEPIVFPSPGRYRIVVDAYPNLPGQLANFQLFRWIDVAGRATPKPLPPFTPEETVDGYRFAIVRAPKLRAIEATPLTITVHDRQGRPARFTPWFGALAHAIFFRAGSLDYFHTHVCSPGATGCTSILGATRITGSSSKPGVLKVGVLVPVPGTWRLFLQCKVNGHVLTAPFTLQVA
jgi:hypothetical protein